MPIPFNQRSYQIFLSHSSKDKAVFADQLWMWLRDFAKVRVYYDRDAEASAIASQLAGAIGNSQSAIFVVSRNSSASGWVMDEYNTIHEEARQHGDKFRILGVRLDDAEPPALLKGAKLLEARDGVLTPDNAMLMLETLFGGGDPTSGKPVYFSRGWHDDDLGLAETVRTALIDCGFRLVCDWPTQESYDQQRIDRLIAGCGAFVAVLPARGENKTSKYVLREAVAAQHMGLPCLAIADKRVSIDPSWPFPSLSAPDSAARGALQDAYSEKLEDLSLAWRTPPAGQHVFVGSSDSSHRVLAPAHRMISRLTGLPVVVGRLVEGVDVPVEIAQKIRDAEFCIIDITNGNYKDIPDKINFALNSCIEAGIAMGAGRQVYLTCAGPDRSPPFMFRSAQVRYYQSELELVGHINWFCSRHRRLVLR